jgi:hypothetical protein
MTIKQCAKCSKDYEYNPTQRYAVCHPCHLERCRELRQKKKPELAENDKLDAEGKRKCRKCETIKSKDDFRKNRRICCDCNKAADVAYRKSDRNVEMSVKYKAVTEGDIEPLKEFYKDRNIEIPETIKPEDVKTLPEVNKKNKNVFRKKRVSGNRKIMTENERKLVKACRLRLKRFFKTKVYKSLQCIGCDSELLKKWLEFNLTDDMTLEDHGKTWHIDHVLPISLFDLTIEREMTICFHWSNLSPLHRIKNMSKGNRIDKEQIKQHLDALKRFVIIEKLTLEEKYFDLFAKHLDAGTPLEL